MAATASKFGVPSSGGWDQDLTQGGYDPMSALGQNPLGGGADQTQTGMDPFSLGGVAQAPAQAPPTAPDFTGGAGSNLAAVDSNTDVFNNMLNQRTAAMQRPDISDMVDAGTEPPPTGAPPPPTTTTPPNPNDLTGDAYYRATYKTPNDYMNWILGTYGANAPQKGWGVLGDEANRIYGLPDGQSIAYDPSRGQYGVYEMPGGGYYSYDNGQWAFHQTSPETGGNPDPTPGTTDNFGQDAFSQSLESGWTNLMKYLGQGGPLDEATAAARGAFTADHRAMLNQSEADLANRGLMSQPGENSGVETTTEQYIDQALTPQYDKAIGDFMTNNISNVEGALTGAGNYQGQMSNVAINLLQENNAFNEFVANYGLNRDQILYQLAHGQNSDLANLIAILLAGANTSAGGHV